ncbi:MAG: site-2 protease family protein [Deltaproteobacteria bacterium]|nr:site-2 protease family protein [Deltaproteobacteria bacterium]
MSLVEDEAAAPRRSPEVRATGQPGQPRRGQGQKSALLGLLAALGLALWKLKGMLLLVLGKLKYLLVGLKLRQLGPLLKSGSTMLLMIWTYSLLYGWSFAAGFVLLLLVHELGHGAAARLVGLRAGAPVFIPFLDAFIALKDQPRSTYQDFLIGAGGPLAGSTGGLCCLAAAGQLGPGPGGLLRALGYFALVVNLFNLMPVWSLDGARTDDPAAHRPPLGDRGDLPGAGLALRRRPHRPRQPDRPLRPAARGLSAGQELARREAGAGGAAARRGP